MPVDRTLTYN